MDRYPYILGCLLGTAAGDAVGLSREGLSRRRSKRMHGGIPLLPNLAMGYGFCSDDTEHTQMTARALAISRMDADKFAGELGWQLKQWLLTLPAGIGMATLRSCFKLLLGNGPDTSGVFSAGNGPAMRSSIIGVTATTDQQMLDLVERCTRITHTDPKAYEGALLVAQASRLAVHGDRVSPVEFLGQMARQVQGEELREHLERATECLLENATPDQFADAQGWKHGISGYINQTVPVALYCWARYPQDFRRCVESAVLLGGDSDTVGAIAGAICGANLGHDHIPEPWLSRIAFWPRGREWHEALARSLEDFDSKSPSMQWLATVPRNLLFATIVITVGMRRLLPPY
ncbi:ADP-ribosylglycohydrolase family protein [Bremerella sp. JC770]|uniref:ADP-ribosylglycohydrolase family protein n=1 Tax=Bremerella sp. JC770 TaxID=3232137 RepID=UPI00345818A9